MCNTCKQCPADLIECGSQLNLDSWSFGIHFDVVEKHIPLIDRNAFWQIANRDDPPHQYQALKYAVAMSGANTMQDSSQIEQQYCIAARKPLGQGRNASRRRLFLEYWDRTDLDSRGSLRIYQCLRSTSDSHYRSIDATLEPIAIRPLGLQHSCWQWLRPLCISCIICGWSQQIARCETCLLDCLFIELPCNCECWRSWSDWDRRGTSFLIMLPLCPPWHWRRTDIHCLTFYIWKYRDRKAPLHERCRATIASRDPYTALRLLDHNATRRPGRKPPPAHHRKREQNQCCGCWLQFLPQPRTHRDNDSRNSHLLVIFTFTRRTRKRIASPRLCGRPWRSDRAVQDRYCEGSES